MTVNLELLGFIASMVGNILFVIKWRVDADKIERQSELNRQLEAEKLALQQRLNREDEVWKRTIPPKLDDLNVIEKWLADGLRIARRYAEISRTINVPEGWHKEEFRHLYHERDKWESQYRDYYALAFRLDPSLPISETSTPTINVPGSMSAMYSIMDLLQKHADEREPIAQNLAGLMQELFDNAHVGIEEMKKAWGAGMG